MLKNVDFFRVKQIQQTTASERTSRLGENIASQGYWVSQNKEKRCSTFCVGDKMWISNDVALTEWSTLVE